MRGLRTLVLIGLLATGCDNSPSPDAAPHASPLPSWGSAPVQSSPSPSKPANDTGLGSFSQVASDGTDIVGTAGTLMTYCVRVEDGIESFTPNEFAAEVDAALADTRSWIAAKRWRFQRVPLGEGARLRVNLAMPATVDKLCAPAARTGGEWSCYNVLGSERAVNINLTRWKIGVAHMEGGMPAYRSMVVNHEFGHFLGHGHVTCSGKGRTAPIMLPQSRGLNGCVFNPYPYPDGVKYVG